MTAGNLATLMSCIHHRRHIQDGETIRTTKLAYKNRSRGLFALGDTIKGITSGAVFEAIGANAGLKWIFASNVTAHSKMKNDLTIYFNKTNCTSKCN